MPLRSRVRSKRSIFSIENPDSSIFWLTKWARRAEAIPGAKPVRFHQCMHGGSRKAARRWLTNLPELARLEAPCDGKHTHAPWGACKADQAWVFATTHEAEYPRLLWEREAQATRDAAQRIGITLSQQGANTEAPRMLAKTRIEAGRQPRGNNYPHLIPEFRLTIAATVEDKNLARWGIRKGDCVKQTGHEWCEAPAGSKILSVESLKSEGGGCRSTVRIGIYHTPCGVQPKDDTTAPPVRSRVYG